jgi:ribosomal protein S18 acetylase RimI-like enzyme
VRVAGPGDAETLKAIALVSHRDTRFHIDGRFDQDRCDQLYGLWIAKSCEGWADRVFVAQQGTAAMGYVTCHLRNGEGQVGLVGVDQAHRGSGSGGAMIAAALGWFRDQQVDRVSVVTQGRNTRGLKFYQRAGFSVTTIQLWYHKWF